MAPRASGGARAPTPAVPAAVGLGALLFGLGASTVALDPAPGSLWRHVWVVPVGLAAVRGGPSAGSLAAVVAVLFQAPAVLVRLEARGPAAPVAEALVSWVVLVALGLLFGRLGAEAREHRWLHETVLAAQQALVDEPRLAGALERLHACLAARLPETEVALAADDGGRVLVAGSPGALGGPAATAALATGTPVFVPDAGDGAWPRRRLVVPLLARGAVLGVLVAERAGELSARERAGIAVLGTHLGLALENARLAGLQRHFTEELAERVAEATRRIEAMDRAKSAFVAVVSHELRTPLTALLGFGELLARRLFPPEEVQRLAGIVHRESERLVRIVDDLLDLSRLERGLGPALSRAAVAVEPALVAAVELFRRAADARPLTVECEPGLPRIDADPDALDRIVKNLVTNAVKYSPPGRPVRVRARALPAARVEIAVEDEGPGIPPEALARIFEPFYRAPGTRARGTGLGLAVVKALVEAHGGTIHVEQAPACGTRVAFEMPAVS